MNKSQLIEAVAKDLALPKNEVKRIVESLFKISVDKLRGGEKVVISGFGVFSVALSAARIGRNPRTGAAVKIAPRRTVRFRSRRSVRRRLWPRSCSKRDLSHAASFRRMRIPNIVWSCDQLMKPAGSVMLCPYAVAACRALLRPACGLPALRPPEIYCMCGAKRILN